MPADAKAPSFVCSKAAAPPTLLLQHISRQKSHTWSLGSDSWRHFTTTSMASRQPKGWAASVPLDPRFTVTVRPARRSATYMGHKTAEQVIWDHSNWQDGGEYLR